MKGEDRKIQIINAALFVLGESGLQGLTTAKIAAKSKISEAAIYRHFTSKEDIVLNVIDTIGRRLFGTLVSVKNEPIDSGSKLAKIFQIHLEHIQKNRGVPRIVYTSEVHLDTNMRSKVFSIIEFYIQTIKDILQEGKKAGVFREDIDLDSEAMQFLSMIQFTAFRYSLSGFNKSMIQEGLTLWNSFSKRLV